MERSLSHFGVLSFDCYGTLIDWERGILEVLRPRISASGRAISDDAVLASFAAAEPACEAEMPTARYPAILRAVCAKMAVSLGVSLTTEDGDALAESVGYWPPFADTVAALARLKRRHRLVILSNVDRASFAGTDRQLGIEFDAVITAEDVGSYKPAPGHFDRAEGLLMSWGITKDRWLHVAESLFHDHVPAKSRGLRTVWVHRRHAKSGFGATPNPIGDVTPDWRVTSLAELADRVERDFVE